MRTRRFTHMIEDEGLHGRFVGAHFRDLYLHTHLVEQILEIEILSGHAAKSERTLGIHEDAVGHTGHIVAALTEIVGISVKGLLPFRSLLELNQLIAQRVESGRRGYQAAAFQIDGHDILVYGRFTKRSRELLQTLRGVEVAAREHSEIGREGFLALLDITFEFEHEHTPLLHFRLLLLGTARQTGHHAADDRGQHHASYHQGHHSSRKRRERLKQKSFEHSRFV